MEKELREEWEAMPHPKISWETFRNKVRMGNEVTEEEQMAKFEKSLKEDDWGHQPA